MSDDIKCLGCGVIMSLADIEGHGHDETDCLASRLQEAEKALSDKRGFGDPVSFMEHHAVLQRALAAESRLGRAFEVARNQLPHDTCRGKILEALEEMVVERQTPKSDEAP